MPWRTIACASTVAVVVPSPATSFVAEATWRTSCAPWFAKVSPSAISSAIVTPSFVIVGAPLRWARTTFRPRGPTVTRTVSATASIPAIRVARASAPNCSPLRRSPDDLVRSVVQLPRFA